MRCKNCGMFIGLGEVNCKWCGYGKKLKQDDLIDKENPRTEVELNALRCKHD